MAGAKAAGNLPSSFLNFGKSIVSAVTHPIDTIKNIGLAATGALDATLGKAAGFQPDQESHQAFSSLASALKERYGSLDNLQQTATNDPFGFGSDILALVSGGAGLVGKTAEVNRTISTVGRTAIKPVAAGASSIANKAGEAAKFITSQETGLEPSTLHTAFTRPGELTAAQKSGLNRATLGQDLQTTIDSRINHLSDIGKGYESVRAADTPVTLPEDWFSKILSDNKIPITSGKVAITKDSTVLSSADVNALQHFYDLYGKESAHTPNSFLNTRNALDQLSKWDAAKTGNLQSIAKDARTELNRFRNQVPGLEKLDKEYAPEVASLKQIKSEWINPKTGELKDTAINRIANAGNAGNDARLTRLETLHPGVTKQIQVLKAVEDIQKSSGIKVGTYARVGTAAGGFALAGPMGAAVAAIMTAPEIAVPLIKGLGLAGEKLKPLLNALHSQASDINHFRLPAGSQIGLSTRNVLTQHALDGAKDFLITELPKSSGKLNLSVETEMESYLKSLQDTQKVTQQQINQGMELMRLSGKDPAALQSALGSSEPETAIERLRTSNGRYNGSRTIPKEGSGEQQLEQATGWRPGDKALFDKALLRKDAPTIRRMLPTIPQEYQTRFGKDIKAILSK